MITLAGFAVLILAAMEVRVSPTPVSAIFFLLKLLHKISTCAIRSTVPSWGPVRLMRRTFKPSQGSSLAYNLVLVSFLSVLPTLIEGIMASPHTTWAFVSLI